MTIQVSLNDLTQAPDHVLLSLGPIPDQTRRERGIKSIFRERKKGFDPVLGPTKGHVFHLRDIWSSCQIYSSGTGICDTAGRQQVRRLLEKASSWQFGCAAPLAYYSSRSRAALTERRLSVRQYHGRSISLFKHSSNAAFRTLMVAHRPGSPPPPSLLHFDYCHFRLPERMAMRTAPCVLTTCCGV